VLVSTNTAAKLVELGESEAVSVVDEDGVCIWDIEA
jgi:hypothetical protein